MTHEQVWQVIASQGLAVAIVVFGGMWIVKVLVPRYLKSLTDAIDKQTSTSEEQTQAIEVQSALLLAFFKANIPSGEFERQLNIVRAMRSRANR